MPRPKLSAPAREAKPIRLAQAVVDVWAPEARSLGVSLPRLIATDLRRYRMLADAAVPRLTPQQWGLISHVLDGLEAAEIITGNDDLAMLGPGRVAAEIHDWMTPHGERAPKWARELHDQVRGWSMLTIAGVLMRLRGEAARKVEDAAE